MTPAGGKRKTAPGRPPPPHPPSPAQAQPRVPAAAARRRRAAVTSRPTVAPARLLKLVFAAKPRTATLVRTTTALTVFRAGAQPG